MKSDLDLSGWKVHEGGAETCRLLLFIRQNCGLLCLTNHPCYRRSPKDQSSLIPVSHNMPSGDLQRATRSGCLACHRHAEKPQMDEAFRPHSFLRHLATPFSTLAKPRRHEASESLVSLAMPCWRSGRLLVWAVTCSLPIESTGQISFGTAGHLLTNDLRPAFFASWRLRVRPRDPSSNFLQRALEAICRAASA